MAVLNKHKDKVPAGAIYIGRGSVWGNPFILGRDGTRDEVCEKYRHYLKQQIDCGTISLQNLVSLHNKDLVCFCKPLRCHGDTLEKAADWAFTQINQKEQT